MMRRTPVSVSMLPLLLVFAGSSVGFQAPVAAQEVRASGFELEGFDPRASELAPSLGPLVDRPASELREVVARYTADRGAMLRRYDVAYSEIRRERLREFYQAWRGRLREIDFDRLGVEGRIDYVLLDSRIRYELELLDREQRLLAEMSGMLPFARRIAEFEEGRRRIDAMDAPAAAASLVALEAEVREARRALEAALGPEAGRAPIAARTPSSGSSDRTMMRASSNRAAADNGAGAMALPPRHVALRASEALASLRQSLGRWYRHYSGYDPIFTWWAAEPYRKADAALDGYQKFLRERVLGIREGQEEPIIGDPIGADGMRADLLVEMIPYTPEELVAIAEREFAWCEDEMKKASRELGFGDDWKAALEHVKTLHVTPGSQPELVRELAAEAVEFLERRGLVTIPPLANEVWRLEMMPPEQQRVAPFFLGGEVVRVSYPTDGMAHEEKLMSMRGNNVHFSRAVVHHELIPGHHLQGFMTQRYNPHRQAFSTPFWGEGWALYWEMLLWDEGFPSTPEDRIGMLFWRMHRAARIIFSLSFHLGTMTPDEAVDFLVDRVGHERFTATGEVRRSFGGNYSPLYQAAYMLGGLQIRALHQELVGSGRMSNREFHDTILQGGRMPIEMVRARLLGLELSRDHTPSWRFAGDPLGR